MDIVRNLIPLVDGDILLYRCGFAADSQAKKEFGDDKYLERDYISWALENTKTVMEDVLFGVFPEHPEYKLYLSGKTNFRDELASIKEYKGNRDPSHKPKYYQEIKQYLKDHWNAEIIEGQEADDAIGICQYSHKERDTVIVSIDKDLDTVPGYHYNWVKGVFYYVTVEDAAINFFRQMLVGDTTDNIPGVRGLGPKRSEKLLPYGMAANEACQVVRSIYEKEFGTTAQERFSEIANLLWIRREPDQPCPFV